MSVHALQTAVRDHLRSRLGYADAECELMPGPKPPNNAGQRFICVHGGGGWSNTMNDHLDEHIGFRVTLSMRVADSPRDRTGMSRLAEVKNGFMAMCHDIVFAIHGSDELRDAANDIIGTDDHDGFFEPPRFRDGGAGEPEEVGPDWFGGTPSSDRLAGLTLTMTFRDARLLTTINNMAAASSARIIREGVGGAATQGYVLREDGSFVLRED